MKHVLIILTLGSIILLQGCTGQKPAELKNPTSHNPTISPECNKIKLEGEVLTQKNILNIFDCTGWNKVYTELTENIRAADTKSLDHALSVANKTILLDKNKQKVFFQMLTDLEQKGQMDQLALLIQKGLVDHKFLGQLDKALGNENLSSNEKSSFLKILSSDNETNLKYIHSLKNISVSLERSKSMIKQSLTLDEQTRFRQRMINFLDELASSMDQRSWGYMSELLYSGNSSTFREWALGGLDGDVETLIGVVKKQDFPQNIAFLDSSIKNGIICSNAADERDFKINVAQELNHIIDSLKKDPAPEFEKTLLHGFSKFIAFRAFCEEDKKKQGLDSFYRIIKYVSDIVTSEHDYNFLQRMHVIFNQDRFALMGLLNGRTFSELRDLFIVLEKDGSDAKFVWSLFELLANIPEADYKVLSELIGELQKDGSRARNWYLAWASMWKSMDQADKEDFIKLISVVGDESLNATSLMDVLESLLKRFPEFSPEMHRMLESEEYQADFRYTVKRFSEERSQKDLTKFLSNKGLFELFKILTNVPAQRRQAITSFDQHKLDDSHYFAMRTSRERSASETRICFNKLSERYENDSSYYALVNTLPSECLQVLGNVGFVGQIYLWMNASQDYFVRRGVTDFHAGTGVWSPPMLQFIFSAAISVDRSLMSSDGKKGIRANLDEIQSVFKNRDVLEAFHQFSDLYVLINNEIPFEKRLLNYLDKQPRPDSVLNNVSSDLFGLLESVPATYKVDARDTSCGQLTFDLGVDPCLKSFNGVADTQKKVFKEKVLDVLRVASRQNEDGKSIVKELLSFIHPDGGIDLPFNKRRVIKTHKSSLKELAFFLHDLSADSTSKEFIYNNGWGEKLVRGTSLDRLEVVIRDISFKNNFYGAYFMNDVGGAKNYRRDVESSENLLKWLDRLSGIFRKTGALEPESKWLLKNVKNSYSSLIEVSDSYENGRTYGDFIQSLLAIVGETSKRSTQSFNAYRVPKSSVVEGHNGVFLTKVVELSGLRNMARFVRSRIKDTSVLSSPEFNMVSSRLLGRHNLKELQTEVQRVLNTYLDNGDNQINLMIYDLIDYLDKIDRKEQKVLEEVVLKGLILFSKHEDQIATKNIRELGKYIEVIIRNWSSVRGILKQTQNPYEILVFINRFLDSALENTNELNGLVEFILKSKSFTPSDLEKMLKSQGLVPAMTTFINHVAAMKLPASNLNWNATLKAIFTGESKEWSPLLSWLQIASSGKSDKLSVSLLLSVLGEKKIVDGREEYKLAMVMDEFFSAHRFQLEQFLQETFPAMELKAE